MEEVLFASKLRLWDWKDSKQTSLNKSPMQKAGIFVEWKLWKEEEQ